MEQIPSQQHHIDILLFCNTHNLMEALPAVIATNCISLCVANMIVCGYEDADCVSGWGSLLAFWFNMIRIREGTRSMRKGTLLTGKARHDGCLCTEQA